MNNLIKISNKKNMIQCKKINELIKEARKINQLNNKLNKELTEKDIHELEKRYKKLKNDNDYIYTNEFILINLKNNRVKYNSLKKLGII